MRSVTSDIVLCACGCGQPLAPSKYKRLPDYLGYISGHNTPRTRPRETRLCDGCGQPFESIFRQGAYPKYCSRPCYHARDTLVARFEAKVDPHGPTIDPTLGPCAAWTGAVRPGGYGFMARGGRDGGLDGAHRIAWELAHGPIPAGTSIHHKCRNPNCVRVDHLEAVTDREHGRRHTKTHCVNGHPLTPENCYAWIAADGRQMRACRLCRTEATKRNRRKAH